MYNFCTYGDRRVKKLKNDSRNLWQMSKTPNTNGIADHSRNSVCLLFFYCNVVSDWEEGLDNRHISRTSLYFFWKHNNREMKGKPKNILGLSFSILLSSDKVLAAMGEMPENSIATKASWPERD